MRFWRLECCCPGCGVFAARIVPVAPPATPSVLMPDPAAKHLYIDRIGYLCQPSGLVVQITKAAGQCSRMALATVLMILEFTVSRSSRDIPSLRGTPAVIITTSAPLRHPYSLLPQQVTFKLSIAARCERSSDFPCGMPGITSNRKTSPSFFIPPSSPKMAPIWPDPTSAIFGLRGIVAIVVKEK